MKTQENLDRLENFRKQNLGCHGVTMPNDRDGGACCVRLGAIPDV